MLQKLKTGLLGCAGHLGCDQCSDPIFIQKGDDDVIDQKSINNFCNIDFRTMVLI